ncbi:MAG: hypothetical protein JW704_13060 [Anaerolineaceae bacterium]|nr:hypothetical protein [Anaerolineaceae bacterium]MBN2678152.1 hypothetical protein [Anaerolineaceae bacterium]
MASLMQNGLMWGSLLFGLTILAGFWLLKTGKPYRTGIFNIHKLLALSASILGIYGFYMTFKADDSLAGWVISLLVAGCILFVVLFSSGTMLSLGKPDHKAVLLGHRLGAGLAILVVLVIHFLKITNPL